MGKPRCQCDSGRDVYPLEDAAGIFCAWVCYGCEDQVKKRFRPQIFEPSSRYAATGEEEDIFTNNDWPDMEG